MKNLILIGGAPMAGKSTVGVELASRLKRACLSTDDIGAALQTVAAIDPMRGMDYKRYYAETPPDRQIKDVLEYHRWVEPALARLIAEHSAWGSPLVMEGWALYPGHVLPLLNENAAAVWLIAKDGLLEKRMAGASFLDNSEAARNYLLRSKWHNGYLLEQCRAAGAKTIEIDGGDSAQALADRILSL